MIISKIPSLRAFPQDSSLNLLPIYYLRIEPWYALKLLRIDQTGSAHQYWPTTAKGVIYYGSFPGGTKQGLHRNEQPPPTQQGYPVSIST